MQQQNLKVELGDIVEFVRHESPEQAKEVSRGYVSFVTDEFFQVKWLESNLTSTIWFSEIANENPKLFSFRVVNDNDRLYFPLEI